MRKNKGISPKEKSTQEATEALASIFICLVEEISLKKSNDGKYNEDTEKHQN